MKFTFKEIGRKIAKIKGGKKDKQFIYMVENEDDLNKLKEGESFDEIILEKGSTIQPLPNKKIVEKLFVAAPSGSGKSYYSGKWIKEYMKMFKDSECFVFSPIEYDKALDSNDIIRVDLDQYLLNNPLKIQDLEDSLVVFDDCESLKSKPMRDYVNYLRDSILETGRHYNIRMIWIAHLISNYTDTRRLLNESTCVCTFPKSGSGTYQIKKFLQIQCGLEKTEISRFLTQPSRWVSIYRSYPQYVMHERGCYFPEID